MNQSFTDFVQTKSNDPKRSIITESISDEQWNELITLVTSIKDKIISVSNAYMNSPVTINKQTNGLTISGPATFNLDKTKIVEIDTSTDGSIKLKDSSNSWGIIHFKTN